MKMNTSTLKKLRRTGKVILPILFILFSVSITDVFSVGPGSEENAEGRSVIGGVSSCSGLDLFEAVVICDVYMSIIFAQLKVFAEESNTTVLHALIDVAVNRNISQFLKYLFDEDYVGIGIKWIDEECSTTKTTPLLYAVQKNNVNHARSLIEFGADMCAKYSDGRSILDVATENKNEEMIELIKSKSKLECVKCVIS